MIGAIAQAAGQITGGVTSAISKGKEVKMQREQANMQREQHKANLTMAMLQAKTQPQQPKSNNQTLIWVGVGLVVMLVMAAVFVLVLRRRSS